MSYEIEDRMMAECPHEDVVCSGLVMCAMCGVVLGDRMCEQVCEKRPVMAGSSNRTMYSEWKAE